MGRSAKRNHEHNHEHNSLVFVVPRCAGAGPRILPLGVAERAGIPVGQIHSVVLTWVCGRSCARPSRLWLQGDVASGAAFFFALRCVLRGERTRSRCSSSSGWAGHGRAWTTFRKVCRRYLCPHSRKHCADGSIRWSPYSMPMRWLLLDNLPASIGCRLQCARVVCLSACCRDTAR